MYVLRTILSSSLLTAYSKKMADRMGRSASPARTRTAEQQGVGNRKRLNVKLYWLLLDSKRNWLDDPFYYFAKRIEIASWGQSTGQACLSTWNKCFLLEFFCSELNYAYREVGHSSRLCVLVLSLNQWTLWFYCVTFFRLIAHSVNIYKLNVWLPWKWADWCYTQSSDFGFSSESKSYIKAHNADKMRAFL